MSDEKAVCQLCGEPMPEGEQMFNYHGYSGPCPKPLVRVATTCAKRSEDDENEAACRARAANGDAHIRWLLNKYDALLASAAPQRAGEE